MYLVNFMIINRRKDEIIILEYSNGIWFEQQSDHYSNILYYLMT